jgi:magnesium transporter
MMEDQSEADDEVLDQTRIDAVLAAVEAGDGTAVDALLDPLHAADMVA